MNLLEVMGMVMALILVILSFISVSMSANSKLNILTVQSFLFSKRNYGDVDMNY